MRVLVAAAMALLPSTVQRFLGRRLLGWQVHPTARLGHSLVLVDALNLGPGASIGSGNVIKGLEELSLGEGARIEAFNWITGVARGGNAFPDCPDRRSALLMGRHAALTTRHLVDCSDTVRLGDHAVLGGNRSTVMTHGMDLATNRATTAAVEIGTRTMAYNGVMIAAGVQVPPRCVLTAGAVLSTTPTRELTVYGGNPARPIGELEPGSDFFHRENLEADAAG